MRLIANKLKGAGLASEARLADGEIVTDASAAVKLVSGWPHYAQTPLVNATAMAKECGVGQIYVKDERARMGLGSFKALGAAFAIAKIAAKAGAYLGQPGADSALKGQSFVCASAGNHGLSMVAGARAFGANAIVFLAQTVPQAFAEKLADIGGTVERCGATYEESMQGAQAAAENNGWQLIADSSWVGYSGPARDVMEGYLVMVDEVARQIEQPPSHIFVQAGVGGLASAVAAGARSQWGKEPVIIIVEPENAPAVIAAIEAGKPVFAAGPVSAMGRLDCKEASHLALKYLAREADFFMTLKEDEVAPGLDLAKRHNLATSPSGGAGLAGFVASEAQREILGINADSRVLFYLSEGEVDD